MAAPKKRQPPEVLRQWIDSVNDEGQRLTPWEINFMESITEQFEGRGFLTEGQEEHLEKIYVEKVP